MLIFLLCGVACDQSVVPAGASTDRGSAHVEESPSIEEKIANQEVQIDEMNEALDSWVQDVRARIPEETLAAVDAALSACVGQPLEDCQPLPLFPEAEEEPKGVPWRAPIRTKTPPSGTTQPPDLRPKHKLRTFFSGLCPKNWKKQQSDDVVED